LRQVIGDGFSILLSDSEKQFPILISNFEFWISIA